MACLLVCPLGCLLLEVFLLTCPLLAMDPPRRLVKRGAFSAKVLNAPTSAPFQSLKRSRHRPTEPRGVRGCSRAGPGGAGACACSKDTARSGGGGGGRQLKKKKKKKQEAEKANKKKTKKETGCLGSCREARWAQDVHVVG